VGDCSPTDDACLCMNPQFIDSVNSCIDASCDDSDAAEAHAAVDALCEAVVSACTKDHYNVIDTTLLQGVSLPN
jgi:hypothetical protein